MISMTVTHPEEPYHTAGGPHRGDPRAEKPLINAQYPHGFVLDLPRCTSSTLARSLLLVGRLNSFQKHRNSRQDQKIEEAHPFSVEKLKASSPGRARSGIRRRSPLPEGGKITVSPGKTAHEVFFENSRVRREHPTTVGNLERGKPLTAVNMLETRICDERFFHQNLPP